LSLATTAAGAAFGDIALVPGPGLKDPKGIRGVEEWYMSLACRQRYLREIFERQCQIALENLGLLRQAVGDKVDVVFMSGSDFGSQRGPMVSRELYRELFAPFNKRLNDWVHTHTRWKTMIHSCGAIEPLLDDIIAAGFDVLNPVQCSADGMDPRKLKQKYGDRLIFWGGGIDTQHVLANGSVADVRDAVLRSCDIFMPDGGFVFNQVHNIVSGVPPENIVAMYDAVAGFC